MGCMVLMSSLRSGKSKNNQRDGVSQEDSDAALKIGNLTKIFEVSSGQEVAVDGFNLNIESGEFITVVGPSGCGKTTTLRCIAGLESPTEGSIVLNNEELSAVPPNKRNIAMMFQSIALYPHMKISKNIAYPLLVRDTEKNPEEEARKAAELMQIGDMMDKYPGELSGGQQQRAALARTVVQQPDLFLMDEPLSDLDAKLKAEMRKEIQRIHNKAGTPTIYVTHDQKEALTMSDRIVVMNDGHIAQVGTPDELYEYPNSVYVARFIGNPTMNFWSGELHSKGERAYASFNNSQKEVDIDKELSSKKTSIKMGIRPQDVIVHSSPGEGVIDCEVQLVERIDDRKLLTLDSPVGEILAFAPPEIPLSISDTVSIGFESSDLHLFNERDGENLRAS